MTICVESYIGAEGGHEGAKLEQQLLVLGHLTPFPAVEPIYTYGADPAALRAFVLQREWRRQPRAVYPDILVAALVRFNCAQALAGYPLLPEPG